MLTQCTFAYTLMQAETEHDWQAAAMKEEPTKGPVAVEVDMPEAGWRPQAASWLRAWAKRIDGRLSPGIRFVGKDRLTEAQQQECLAAGFKAMAMASAESAMEAAVERRLMGRFPHLYGLGRVWRREASSGKERDSSIRGPGESNQ